MSAAGFPRNCVCTTAPTLKFLECTNLEITVVYTMYASAIKDAIASTFFTLNEDAFAFAEWTVGGTGAKLGFGGGAAILSFGKAGSGR